ncbi:NAD(P)H-binding protein [Streptomyces sp. NPDC051976]|uniref:NAD(P)H-binding protein n=1 Tax=Streptomyces sp. NPDC051976 TaxID=3154947 RepID=UPI003435591F
MLVVTGASGNVGGELVRVLAGQGRAVRAVVRDTGAYEAPPGVETTAGDLNRPDSLNEVFAGAEGLFLLGGFPDMPGALKAARAAGIQHVVLLSSRSVVGGHADNAVVAMHQDSEAAVRASGLAWTILRPSGFMSNTLGWASQIRAGDEVRVPFAQVPIAAIAPYDIAAVAAAVLGRPEHHGLAHALSGPAALLPADQLTVLSHLLDRPLRLVAQSDDEARAEMSATTPARFVDAFFRFFSDGEFDDSAVLGAVEEITGQPPRTYEDWARTHVRSFR